MCAPAARVKKAGIAIKFIDGRADESDAREALMIELEKQKERIMKVEKEIAGLNEEQENRRKILENFLKHLKEGAWRIENTLERRAQSGERR